MANKYTKQIRETIFLRQFINIIEAAGGLAGDDLHQVYDLISEYVTYGQMRTDGQFDEQFDTLWNILPRPKGTFVLYRVLSLAQGQVDHLVSGSSITLRSRTYSSWTKSAKAVGRLIAARRGRPDEVVVIIRKEVSGSEIVMDVAKFYKTNNFTDGYDEWGRYVQWEQEVIVRSEEPLTITPDDVEQIVKDGGPVSPPEPGDYVTNTSGNEEEIEDVSDNQPRGSEGIFFVFVNGGEKIKVQSTGDGSWEEVA